MGKNVQDKTQARKVKFLVKNNLFQGQTVDLKFPYLGRSRFLCSQQRGPGHLGSMPQENMQRTTNLFFL